MNILFLSIGGLADLGENAVYPDLLRCFHNHGHSVYVVCQREKRIGLPTQMNIEHGIQVLRVQTGNITKVGLIEKGITTLLIGSQFKKAINKYFSDVSFNLILYSTPPITLANTVAYLKNRDKSYTYLMLKDIFPQNAVDIGILKKTGLKALIYYYFKNKEKKLYLISDFIGCMSEANMRFLKEFSPYIEIEKIGLCPNTIDPLSEEKIDRALVRSRFILPQDKLLFVYGGNFGKPQDVDYIIDVLKSNEGSDDRYFIMCGSGTDFCKIKEYVNGSDCKHVKVMDSLNKKDYGLLLSVCDVGLIFLDHRFTIPNFPSRLLDYMNRSIPVLAATDRNTDVGNVITDGGFGWWCESNSVHDFNKIVDEICCSPHNLREKGKSGRLFLENNYNTEISYGHIMKVYEKAINN